MSGTKRQCARKLQGFLVPEKKYNTGEKSIIRWFNLLNKLLFDEKLPQFNKIYIRKRNSTWAMCISQEKNGDYIHELRINTEFPTRRTFVNILAHEMIHINQYEFGERSGHGPSFWRWKPVFEKHGLILREEYGY